MPTEEQIGLRIGEIALDIRSKTDRFFNSVENNLRRLNARATREASKVYNYILSSLVTMSGTSIPENTISNLSLISRLMQGVDAIQDKYRRAYGELLQQARGDLVELTTEREYKIEKALQKIGIEENRTDVSFETFNTMEISHRQTLKKMNDILMKWRNFAYNTFYAGIIRGVPIAVFRSMFFNKDGSLKVGSSLDEESMIATMTSIGEQRTSYIRKKAEESGYKFCWNANPMDPQTKPECIDASIAGVISEAEMGSGYGFPPRYICRCELVYTRPEWVRVNRGINNAIESRRNILVQSLIDAPRQMASWKVKGQVVRATDITRLQGNLMYKETADKLKLLADRGAVPDFVPPGYLGGGGIPPVLPPTRGLAAPGEILDFDPIKLTQARKKAALSKLEDLPIRTKYGEWTDVYFGRAINKTSKSIISAEDKNFIFKNLKTLRKKVETRVVSIKNLKATQIDVTKFEIRKFINEFSEAKFTNPSVIKYKGELWVIDGHTRITARSLLGGKNVKVDFADLDDLLKSQVKLKKEK